MTKLWKLMQRSLSERQQSGADGRPGGPIGISEFSDWPPVPMEVFTTTHGLEGVVTKRAGRVSARYTSRPLVRAPA